MQASFEQFKETALYWREDVSNYIKGGDLDSKW